MVCMMRSWRICGVLSVVALAACNLLVDFGDDADQTTCDDGDVTPECVEGAPCCTGTISCSDSPPSCSDDKCNCPVNLAMVMVRTPAIHDFCIDPYEISETGDGFVSIPGEIPRIGVQHDDASNACEAVGKRLCTRVQWQAACRGPDNFNYPYGDSYQDNICNGNRDAVGITGEFDDCESGYLGIFDMSGNACEWTTYCEHEVLATCHAVGGSALSSNVADRLSCQGFLQVPVTTSPPPDVGFRCCMSIP